ncbi:hypothetical protein Tco_0398217 [Tanacetum coccineum]
MLNGGEVLERVIRKGEDQELPLFAFEGENSGLLVDIPTSGIRAWSRVLGGLGSILKASFDRRSNRKSTIKGFFDQLVYVQIVRQEKVSKGYGASGFVGLSTRRRKHQVAVIVFDHKRCLKNLSFRGLSTRVHESLRVYRVLGRGLELIRGFQVRMKALLEQQGLAAALGELPTPTISAYNNVIQKKLVGDLAAIDTAKSDVDQALLPHLVSGGNTGMRRRMINHNTRYKIEKTTCINEKCHDDLSSQVQT